jgi:hypothetical protein
MPDYYAVLDLPSTATAKQIDERYQQFVRMFDPALYNDPAELAYVQKKRNAAEEAYQALSQHLAEIEQWQTDLQATATVTSADGTINQRRIDFTDGRGTPTPTAPHSSHTPDRAYVRWLHKFLRTSATIVVAALIGTVVLDQGLGMLAYVAALQKGEALPVAQFAIEPAQPLATSDCVPIYSADRQQVALVTGPMDKQQIFLKQANNDKVQSLASVTRLQSLPLWSPQADKIAFLDKGVDGLNIQIFHLATKQLTTFQPPARLGQLGRIGWSDDGMVLFFESHAPKMPAATTLWRIDSAGQNLARLLASVPAEVIWSTSLP